VVKYLALLWLVLGFPAALAANGVALSIVIQRVWVERSLQAIALLLGLVLTLWLVFYGSLWILPGRETSDSALAVMALLLTLAVTVIAPVLRWATLRRQTYRDPRA
jgi:hypothetical protein